jgi:hypothetical protein
MPIIDRYLIFYIRTADKLQRTAPPTKMLNPVSVAMSPKLQPLVLRLYQWGPFALTLPRKPDSTSLLEATEAQSPDTPNSSLQMYHRRW